MIPSPHPGECASLALSLIQLPDEDNENEETKEFLEKSDLYCSIGISTMESRHDAKVAKPPYFSLFSPKSLRLWICALITTGLCATVSMRLNLSMAIVCMVNSTAFLSESPRRSFSKNLETNASSKCGSVGLEGPTFIGYTGDLLWSPAMQAVLLSATFYGGLATISFAGTLADKYGPKMIIIAVTLDYIIVTLLTPVLARWSYYAYFVSRVIMGIGEGFLFPCFASLVGNWYAPAEKSTVAALYTSGNQLAASFGSLISSYLCKLGWPIIFYMFGGAGCIWLIFWTIFVTNSPMQNKFISKKEKEYLAEHIHHGNTKTTMSIPWRKMLTSRPLLAAIVCQYSYNMQASLLQAFLPTFLKEELLIPLDKNGIYTMIPFIAQMISKNIFALIADYMKRNNLIGHTKCAKIFQTIGSFGSAASLILLATIPTCDNYYPALPLLAFYGTFFSAGIPGFFTCLLCIAPPFSGSISSIAMVLGTLGNISGPMLLGFTAKLGFTQKWMASFIICACINVVAGTVFMIFGSAKVQEWAKVKPSLPSSA